MNWIAIICALVLAIGVSDASTKTGRTYYTAERMAAMRENVERYQWARNDRANIIQRADRWLEYSDDELRMMVPPPELPRSPYVRETGCPEHGLDIRRFGTYAWETSLDEPFKVTCPVGGESYPDNDFMAYYRSGWDGHRWDPERADRSLLTGGAIIDDGWGWDDPADDSEQKYWFVAYYTHWVLVEQVVAGVLEDCSRAYLLTGDPAYAHKAAIVLWQLAEYYPDYAYEKQSRRGTEIDPNYLGKLLYHTWETRTVSRAALAYDAVFPALAEDEALQEQVGQSGAEIAEHIESRMLRLMARLIIDGSRTIQGNYGMHQKALLHVAIVCGDEEHEPTRSQMVGWVMSNEEVGSYTEMSMQDALHNVVFRDGVPFESPGYNLHWVTNLLEMAKLLAECGVDVVEMPRLRRLADWPLDMVCAGEFTPALGDSGDLYHGSLARRPDVSGPAFKFWRDPRHAWVFTEMDATWGRDLFEPQIDEEAARVAEQFEGPLGVDPHLFPGYGMTILQTGNEANRTAIMLYQGAGRWAHAHFDSMHLDIYSRGNPLIPDFGYPETANSNDPRRFGFISHTVAHNLVMVDASRSDPSVGVVTNYDPAPGCSIVDAHNPEAYPDQTETYRRTLALIDVTPEDAYVIDIFRVEGGSQHDWIVHGTDAEFATQIPLTEPREEGTLAGPDVPYGMFYDDPALRDKPYGSVSYAGYTGSGFQFLYNVQEAALDGSGVVEWRLRRTAERPPSLPTEDIALRAHLLSDGERLYVCDGKPQQNTNRHPESVKFLLRRRQGDDLRSAFVTVFEPIEGEPFLREVTRLEATPAEAGAVALRIERADGGADIFVSTSDPTRTVEVEGGLMLRGEAGFVSLNADGSIRDARLSNGELLRFGEMELTARAPRRVAIEDVDLARGIVTLAEGADLTDALTGQWAPLGNDVHRTIYRIDEVLDDRRFSIATQSTLTGRLLPTGYDAGTGRLTTGNFSYFTRPGMYLADEQMRVLGRIERLESSRALILEDAPAIALGELPDADGDGSARLWVLDFAAGDEISLPSRARMSRR